jgi:hypothetical protein
MEKGRVDSEVAAALFADASRDAYFWATVDDTCVAYILVVVFSMVPLGVRIVF